MEGLDEGNEAVRSLVSRQFRIASEGYEDGALAFVVEAEDVKRSFIELAGEMRASGRVPFLRRRGGAIMLKVFSAPQQAQRGRRYLGPLLLAATVAVVFYDGYLRFSWYSGLRRAFDPQVNPLVEALLFLVAVMGVFGAHEMGHKTSAARSGLRASGPYFLPGIPGVLPTFGAVIAQTDLPVNRDALVSLGFSGPASGFAMLIFISILAQAKAVSIPASFAAVWSSGPTPILGPFEAPPFSILSLAAALLPPPPDGVVTVTTELGFAAWLGSFVTFINLLPASQLDGGHIARSVLGSRLHRWVAVPVILLMVYPLRLYLMAVFVFIIWLKAPHQGALDEASPLSRANKLKVILALAIGALCYAPLPL